MTAELLEERTLVTKSYRIAAVQMDVQLGQVEVNLNAMLERLEVAVAAGSQLTIFPECSLSGYCFDSRDEALPFAQTIPGPSCSRLSDACSRLGTFAIMGMLESAAGKLFNACVLVGPSGVVASYRKIPLPFL